MPPVPVHSISLKLAKIMPPALQGPVHRTALLEILGQSVNYALTMIISHAGSGKTTLAAEFVTGLEFPVAWLSLDASDQDLYQFCTYLVEAVRRVVSNFAATEKGFVFPITLKDTRKNISKTSNIPATVVERLADDLLQDLQLLVNLGLISQLWIVLDDYQFADSPALNQLLIYLGRWLPPEIHIMLLGRELPHNFPHTEFRLKHRELVVGLDKLKFTLEEIEELIISRYGSQPEPELTRSVKLLADFTESWAVALTLVMLGLDMVQQKNSGQPLSFEQLLTRWLESNRQPLNKPLLAMTELINQPLFNYLASSLFSQQPLDRQRFLLKTSVLKVLSIPVCDNLLDQPGASRSHLNALNQQQMFITLLEGNQELYQYHVLIKTYLQLQLAANENLYRETHLRAGQISEEAGEDLAAIDHYLKSGDKDQALRVLDRAGLKLYETGRMKVLAELLEQVALSSEQLENYPNLIQVKALLRQETGLFEEARELFLKTSELYRTRGEPDLAVRAKADAIISLIFEDNYTLAEKEAVRLKASLMVSENSSIYIVQAAGIANFALGTVEQRNGRFTLAETYYQAAESLYESRGDLQRYNATLATRASVYIAMGKLIKARTIYQRNLIYWQKTGNLAREVYSQHMLASILRLSGRYEEGITALEENLIRFEELGFSYLKPYTLFELGDCYRDHGDLEQAIATYGEVRQEVQGKVPLVEIELLASLGLAHWMQGDRVKANQFFEEGLELTGHHHLPQKVADIKIVQALTALGLHRLDVALGHLQDLKDNTAQYPNPPLQSRALFQEGIAFFEKNFTERAALKVVECLEFSESFLADLFIPAELRLAGPLLTYLSANFRHLNLREDQNFLVEDFLVRVEKSGYLTLPVEVTATLTIVPVKQPATNGHKPANGATPPETKAPEIERLQNVEPVPSEATAILRLKAFDGGRVFLGDQEITKWDWHKTRWLLFFLAEYPGASLDKIQTEVWPEGEEVKTNTVHSLLSNLRNTIHPIKILRKNNGYSLEAGFYEYDRLAFERLARRCLAAKASPNVDDLEHTLTLYTGEFLPDLSALWAERRRRQLADLYLECATLLARTYFEAEKYHEAISTWRRVLQHDKYNDEAHLNTITANRLIGLEGEALREQQVYNQLLLELLPE